MKLIAKMSARAHSANNTAEETRVLDSTSDGSMGLIYGFGKNGTQTAVIPSNIKILNRNNGLLLRSMVKIMTTDEIFDKKTGTVQMNIEDAWKRQYIFG